MNDLQRAIRAGLIHEIKMCGGKNKGQNPKMKSVFEPEQKMKKKKESK
jgi:hypothetical protein